MMKAGVVRRFLAQQVLMQELDKVAEGVKQAKDSSRANILLRYLHGLPTKLEKSVFLLQDEKKICHWIYSSYPFGGSGSG